MRVLQLGTKDWQRDFEIPQALDWHFNDFPESDLVIRGKKQRPKFYDVVLITGQIELADSLWKKLQWLVNPYQVLYDPNIYNTLSAQAKLFLKCDRAKAIDKGPQAVIDELQSKYYGDQSGIRISPQGFIFNDAIIQEYEFSDSDHIHFKVNAPNQWTSLGSYRYSVFLNAQRTFDFWLESKNTGVQIRLRIFVQPNGADGNINDNEIFMLDYSSTKQWHLSIPASDQPRFCSIGLEVKGKGDVYLGQLHRRWHRNRGALFFNGGKRIVNPENREDVAYFFNPGDLKPPLNVYFAGARSLEGFEAYHFIRSLHAPSISFTDMRLDIGQFYNDRNGFMGEQVKKTILRILHELHFDRSQLIMTGISMGSYPAMKYGSELGAYMIDVAKPLANLGYIASRFPLQRPYNTFDTILDIDHQIQGAIDPKSLEELNKSFWVKFNQQDLSKTRLLVSYMKNDDYDNHSIELLKSSPAVKHAAQFSCKGFIGRHNDDFSVTIWFMTRLRETMKNDFGRKS